MVRNTLPVVFILIFLQVSLGQNIAINTDGSSPHTSAILDIQSPNKGLLIPRMTLAQRNSITFPAAGLMIYQTDNGPGLYTYNGSSWSTPATTVNVWSTAGNNGTDPAIHFIGTSDNNPLRFRTGNSWAGELNQFSRNLSLGDSSGVSTTGIDNTSYGHRSLKSNTSGFANVAIGSHALQSSTIGNYNVAVGYRALLTSSSGGSNIALGSFALEGITTGSFNVALGGHAMRYATTAEDNAAIGAYSLNNLTTGNKNIGIGTYSLNGVTTGHYNIGIGFGTLGSNTSGSHNIAIGDQTLFGNVNGTNNIAIGTGAGTSSSFNNTVSIGNQGWLNGANNQVFLGNASMQWIGGWTNWSNYSDARIKKDIQEDVRGLDFINRLRPVTYHRNVDLSVRLTGNEPTEDYPGKYDVETIRFSGFLAQEVEQAAIASGYDFSGYTVPKDENSLYTISYESFVVPLVKAIQEQQVIIEELLKRIEALEKE